MTRDAWDRLRDRLPVEVAEALDRGLERNASGRLSEQLGIVVSTARGRVVKALPARFHAGGVLTVEPLTE